MDPIVLSAIKKAKEELALKLESGTSGTGSALAQLKASLEEKLSPWTGTRAAKLDNLDAKVSSRADGSYYTPGRASKLDKLDKLDTTVSSRLSKADFYAWDSANGTVLDDLKKSSAEYRDRIAAVLGQMDAAGLSTGDSIKLLTQYLEGIPIIGAASSTLTTQGGSYTIPRGYHNGKGSVRTNITNLRPENIKNGANVGGVMGGYAGPMRTSGSVIETLVKVPYPKNYSTHRIESNIYQAPEPIQAIYFKWDMWTSSYYGVLVLPRMSLLVATNSYDKYTIVERASFWNGGVKIYPVKYTDDYSSVYIYMINEKSFKVVTTCTSEIQIMSYEKEKGEMDCGTRYDSRDGLQPYPMTAYIYY